MTFDIITTPNFEKAFKVWAKRHRSLAQDLLDFTKSLEQNPFQGDELTSGIRKIRMAIKSKGHGKSGGARVITFTALSSEADGSVFLIDIYDKSDYSTVDVDVIRKIAGEYMLAEGDSQS